MVGAGTGAVEPKASNAPTVTEDVAGGGESKAPENGSAAGCTCVAGCKPQLYVSNNATSNSTCSNYSKG